MLAAKKVLDYLADVSGLGSGLVVRFGELTRRWEIALEEVRKGILVAPLTDAMRAACAEDYPRSVWGARGVGVLVCLVAVRPKDGSGPCDPLLVLPGELDSHGHLLPLEHGRAFVPQEHLSSDGVRNRTLCVCDLDAYRAHQLAMSSLPDDGSWTTAVSRAVDLFHAVSTLDPQELDAMGLSLVEDVCTIALCDHPSLGNPATALLQRAALACDDQGEALRGPARTLLFGDRDHARKDEDGIEELPEDLLLNHKLLYGAPGHLPTLTPSDHEVLASFSRQTRGDLLMVRAPAGTNAPVVALHAMANLLTECVLRGDRVPLMACVGTARTLEGMLGLLSRRPTYGQTAVPSRWLPRIAQGAPSLTPGPGGRKVLGSLGALAMVHVAEGEDLAAGPSALVERFGHPADGDAACYADPWYVPKATLHYLDCASSFLGTRVRDVAEAAGLLSEHLRLIDQKRCELVDAYAEVCRAAEQLRERDVVVAQLVPLRRAHKQTRERLVYWEGIAQGNPPKRSIITRAQPDQSKLIQACRQDVEPLAEGCVLVEDVCTAYRNELERVESEIDRLRGLSATLARRVRAASPEGQRCSEIIADLVRSCGLNNEQAEQLESVMDGHDTSAAYLDVAVDKTVRQTEFWLAVHVCEARWLERCARQPREDWRTLACLCPLSFLTPGVALGKMAEDAAGATDGRPAVDLLVVLDANEVDAPEGVALLSQTERALVMGTDGSLMPLATFGDTSGDMHARSVVGDEVFDLMTLGVVGSRPSTLFGLGLLGRDVKRVRLSDTYDTVVELADLRSELVPGERVDSVESGMARDVETRTVMRVLPPLSHVLVPDSAWGQVGGSRRNRAEALAVTRWVTNHASDLLSLHALTQGSTGRPVAIVTPYELQAELLREVLGHQADVPHDLVDVLWLPEAVGQAWPVVLLCSTCGPESIDDDCAGGTRSIISTAAALARDALVMFCGGSWAKSACPAAVTFMRRSIRVGRLFSVARQERGKVDGADARLASELHSKPLSLTALLARLKSRGDLACVPSTASVNKALGSVGLIERVRTEKGSNGWRPTAAGREVGILATVDHNGCPFCSYTVASMPVIASIVDSMEPEE